MATYNGEKFLQEQIESIIHQTYTNFEFIIIDDNSEDSTYQICYKYAEKDSRIKLFRNEKNLGLNKNFEKAIKIACGDYLVFADQDDIWDLSKIEKLLKLLSKSDDILIYCDSEMIDEHGKSMGVSSGNHQVFIKGNNPNELLFYNTVSGHKLMFKKELIKHILPIPKDFYYDWWIAYIATGLFSINYTNEKLVKYRIHRDSYVQKNALHETRTNIIDKKIYNLKYLRSSPINSNHKLIDNLIYGLNHTKKRLISLTFIKSVMKHRKELLKSRILPTYSKWKIIRAYLKISLGIKR